MTHFHQQVIFSTEIHLLIDGMLGITFHIMQEYATDILVHLLYALCTVYRVPPYCYCNFMKQLESCFNFFLSVSLYLFASSGLHRSQLFSPWGVYSWRVSLSARLGWSQLWNCQGYVSRPVLRPWHIQPRNQYLYLWPELDWARLLLRCVSCHTMAVSTCISVFLSGLQYELIGSYKEWYHKTNI